MVELQGRNHTLENTVSEFGQLRTELLELGRRLEAADRQRGTVTGELETCRRKLETAGRENQKLEQRRAELETNCVQYKGTIEQLYKQGDKLRRDIEELKNNSGAEKVKHLTEELVKKTQEMDRLKLELKLLVKSETETKSKFKELLKSKSSLETRTGDLEASLKQVQRRMEEAIQEKRTFEKRCRSAEAVLR